MAVNIKITQKGLFKKNLSIEQIAKENNLSYGISDDNYRLVENEISNYTLLYNKKVLSRGIEISISKNDIFLQLNLPTSIYEIESFYNLIENICKKIKVNKYIRDEELVNVKDNSIFIKYDKEASTNALITIKENLDKEKYSHLEIFGIKNPISIGKIEIEKIDTSLEKFEKLLNDLQNFDYYYAAPRVYKKENKLIGIYVVGENILSVIPTEPYVVLKQISNVEEWYIMLGENNIIRYNDFINNLNNTTYYDNNHILINLTKDEIEQFITNFKTEI